MSILVLLCFSGIAIMFALIWTFVPRIIVGMLIMAIGGFGLYERYNLDESMLVIFESVEKYNMFFLE